MAVTCDNDKIWPNMVKLRILVKGLVRTAFTHLEQPDKKCHLNDKI